MSLTIAPLTSRIRQRLPGARALESFAVETVIVQPPEDAHMRPAVYLEDELERITDVHEFSAGIDDELLLATCDRVHHTETIAYLLRDLCVSQSRLCNLYSYRKLTYRDASAAPAHVTDITDTVAFCSNAAGNDYFAHLLLDDACTALLGSEFGKVVFGGRRRARTAHMGDYLAFFGIDYQETNEVRLQQAWIFTDHAQNFHRRERLEALRKSIRSRFPGRSGAPVYLRRGSSGSARLLDNEAELEAELEQRGFVIVDPETLSTDEICKLLAATPLVVGVEGSQLVHGLLSLRPGGGLLCIQPAARFNAVYRGFCNSVGLEWGFVVAEGSAGHFRLPPDRLLRTIDKLTATTEKTC